MNKYLFLILSCFLLASCAEDREVSSLNQREGITYAINETEPFTGKLIMRADSGQLRVDMSFVDGKRDGLFIRWFNNGQKRSEVAYTDGKREGLAHHWYENGQKKITIDHTNDDAGKTVAAWDKNGQKK